MSKEVNKQKEVAQRESESLRLKEKEWMALGELADLMQMQREELEKDIGTLRQQDEELIETLDRRIA